MTVDLGGFFRLEMVNGGKREAMRMRWEGMLWLRVGIVQSPCDEMTNYDESECVANRIHGITHFRAMRFSLEPIVRVNVVSQ